MSRHVSLNGKSCGDRRKLASASSSDIRSARNSTTSAGDAADPAAMLIPQIRVIGPPQQKAVTPQVQRDAGCETKVTFRHAIDRVRSREAGTPYAYGCEIAEPDFAAGAWDGRIDIEPHIFGDPVPLVTQLDPDGYANPFMMVANQHG